MDYSKKQKDDMEKAQKGFNSYSKNPEVVQKVMDWFKSDKTPEAEQEKKDRFPNLRKKLK